MAQNAQSAEKGLEASVYVPLAMFEERANPVSSIITEFGLRDSLRDTQHMSTI